MWCGATDSLASAATSGGVAVRRLPAESGGMTVSVRPLPHNDERRKK
jgi:hypothetical protein